jgi:flagellar hook-associated protein 2
VTTIGSVGTSLDVASIVEQLVSAERAPADARMDRSDRRLQAEISAIGTLRSAFSSLRTAANTLAADRTSLARKVSVPEGAGFSASAGSTAAVGRHQVEVLALSSAHKLATPAYASADSTVGSGRLTVTCGETTLEVDIGDDAKSLSAIRDAINAEAAGKGVVAGIVIADDGAHLVLTALDSGAANAIRITADGGDGGLAALAYDPPVVSQMQQVSAAADARVRVDGFERSSANNRVTDLIPGVTLDLAKAEPGTVHQLDVAVDSTAQRDAVRGFVNAYNASLAAINTTTSYNSSTQVAAALNGDAMVRGAARGLRELVSGQVGELKALGLTIQKDGTLKLDQTEFDAAIAVDPDAGARLFGEDSAIGAGMKTTLDRLLDADGLLAGRSSALDGRTRALAKERTAVDRRMEQVEARYRAQFTALDSLVTKLQSTSSYLSQQLSSLG